MAFMIPQYTSEPFWLVDTTAGGEAVPVSVAPDGALSDFLEGEPEGEVERVEGKHWARLSAPGYLDATDWGGPFESLDEARAYIEETYEVDPETGDRLPEE